MKTLFYTAVAAFALGFVACKGGDNSGSTAATTATTAATTTSTPATPAPAPAAEPARKVTKMTTEGKLEGAEDAGYPMAYIMLADKGGETVTFNFNQEDGKGLKIEAMNPMLGKNVVIEYERVEFLDAFDISLNGKSILERPAGTNCVKEIKGVLNAPQETQGDLPSSYSIKATDGTVYNFETFITKEMVAANGKEVTACLINATQDNLLSIKAK